MRKRGSDTEIERIRDRENQRKRTEERERQTDRQIDIRLMDT